MITQKHIDSGKGNAVITNHALGTNGIAMRLETVINGYNVAIYLDMLDGETQETEDIYKTERIILHHILDEITTEPGDWKNFTN